MEGPPCYVPGRSFPPRALAAARLGEGGHSTRRTFARLAFANHQALVLQDSRRCEQRLFYMPRDEFGHLEHADLLLATKDHLQVAPVESTARYR